MSKYKTILELELPKNVNDDDFKEWFIYEVLHKGSCKTTNPIIDNDVSDFLIDYSINTLEN